jgi:hypothetical protein
MIAERRWFVNGNKLRPMLSGELVGRRTEQQVTGMDGRMAPLKRLVARLNLVKRGLLL